MIKITTKKKQYKTRNIHKHLKYTTTATANKMKIHNIAKTINWRKKNDERKQKQKKQQNVNSKI